MGVGGAFRKNAKTVPEISQIRDERKVLDTSQANRRQVGNKRQVQDRLETCQSPVRDCPRLDRDLS